MAYKIKLDNCNDIGVYTLLTNKYCIYSTPFLRKSYILNDKLVDIPLLFTTIGDLSCVGRLCIGNSNGLILPSILNKNEKKFIYDQLDYYDINIKISNDLLNTLGNLICCNDKQALVSSHLSLDTIDLISDTLNVEVLTNVTLNNNNNLLGTYCKLNNNGALLSNDTTVDEFDTISQFLDVPCIRNTLNYGSNMIGSCLSLNDNIAFIGNNSTPSELNTVENIFKLSNSFVNYSTMFNMFVDLY